MRRVGWASSILIVDHYFYPNCARFYRFSMSAHIDTNSTRAQLKMPEKQLSENIARALYDN